MTVESTRSKSNNVRVNGAQRFNGKRRERTASMSLNQTKNKQRKGKKEKKKKKKRNGRLSASCSPEKNWMKALHIERVCGRKCVS